MSDAEVAPDYVEPLRAWRLWRVVERDGALLLGSVVKPTVWPVGQTLVARCLHAPFRLPWRTTHAAPQASCDCGIYASSLPHAADYARELRPRRAVGWAIGLVSLWGTVVECERGYRASHAYPAEVWVPWPEDRAGIDRIEVAARLAGYGIAVSLLDGRAREAPELLAPEPDAGRT